MSLLGKILTVLMALVAVVVAALAAREFVLSNNWKKLYEDEVALFRKACDQRDDAIKQRDDQKAGRDADKLLMQGQINTLTETLALRDNTIRTMTTDAETLKAQYQQLTTQFAGLRDNFDRLMKERDGWRKERDDAKKMADDLRIMYTELEARYRNTQSDLASAKEQLRQAREMITTLDAKLAYINQNWPEAKVPDPVPAIPSVRMNGLVTKVDNEAKVAEINLGSDDKVVKGMKFYIYDAAEMKYLATLTINMVGTNSAAGDLSVIKGTVKVNDHVTNRFE